MLTPTTNYILEDDTLAKYHEMVVKSDKLFDKVDVYYSKISEADVNYDKELISADELDSITNHIEDDIEECNRQIELIEDEAYRLFDNLETLV